MDYRQVLTHFLADQAARLQEVRRRMAGAIRQLDDEAANWRPNDQSNSVANLVLHVSGNVEQRILSGIAGAPDRRDRDAEFANRERWTVDALIQKLDEAFNRAEAVLATLDADTLLDPVHFQGQSWTRLRVINHVVAHASEHLGQILYIAKLRLGDDYAYLSLPPPGGRKAEF